MNNVEEIKMNNSSLETPNPPSHPQNSHHQVVTIEPKRTSTLPVGVYVKLTDIPAHLGIHLRTVERAVREGELKVVRPGRKLGKRSFVRVKVSDLEEWINR